MRPHPPSPRAALLVVVAVLGALFVVSATASKHPGPRFPRTTALVELIRRQDARARDLRAKLDELRGELDALRARDAGAEGTLASIRSDIDALSPGAGLAPVSGPGVSVELRDSTLARSPTGDPNDLVIHEQDLQAVVNGLWAGGAEAIAVNGERLTSVSAIRCVGNTLLLHGAVYAPPYVIDAVGDSARLARALEGNMLLERLRLATEEFRLGFKIGARAKLSLPAYRGIVTARFATPVS